MIGFFINEWYRRQEISTNLSISELGILNFNFELFLIRFSIRFNVLFCLKRLPIIAILILEAISESFQDILFL
tara:strand:+ start:146 stop:364 length:219 start_codon:yes stop_codon:yes gene_type:complete